MRKSISKITTTIIVLLSLIIMIKGNTTASFLAYVLDVALILRLVA